MSHPRTLVALDFDRTTAHLPHAWDLVAAALRRLHGGVDYPRDILRQLVTPGDPEHLRLAAALTYHGLPARPDDVRLLVDTIVDEYRRQSDDISRRIMVMPGVVTTMETIAARPGTVCTFVTANVKPILNEKLRAAGITTPALRTELGGYGDRGRTRRDLLVRARRRARADVVVAVDDSPYGIATAAAAGALSLGVTALRHYRDHDQCTRAELGEQLRRAGATRVVDDLADPGPLLDVIEQAQRGRWEAA